MSFQVNVCLETRKIKKNGCLVKNRQTRDLEENANIREEKANNQKPFSALAIPGRFDACFEGAKKPCHP
jgi:hypothetical protein